MSEISVIVYEWKDLALRALLDRETDKKLYTVIQRERDKQKKLQKDKYIKKTYRQTNRLMNRLIHIDIQECRQRETGRQNNKHTDKKID